MLIRRHTNLIDIDARKFAIQAAAVFLFPVRLDSIGPFLVSIFGKRWSITSRFKVGHTITAGGLDQLAEKHGHPCLSRAKSMDTHAFPELKRNEKHGHPCLSREKKKQKKHAKSMDTHAFPENRLHIFFRQYAVHGNNAAEVMMA